jgi:hypothetical protein
MEDNILPPFEYVRGVIDHAVNSALLKIENIERKRKVLEVLSQVSNNSIIQTLRYQYVMMKSMVNVYI